MKYFILLLPFWNQQNEVLQTQQEYEMQVDNILGFSPFIYILIVNSSVLIML